MFSYEKEDAKMQVKDLIALYLDSTGNRNPCPSELASKVVDAFEGGEIKLDFLKGKI